MGVGGAIMAAMNTLDDIHRLTVEEYLLLAQDPSWERTELIGGVVYDRSNRMPPSSTTAPSSIPRRCCPADWSRWSSR
jgi:hypothetical protein